MARRIACASPNERSRDDVRATNWQPWRLPFCCENMPDQGEMEGNYIGLHVYDE